jgi:hypothetical protein
MKIEYSGSSSCFSSASPDKCSWQQKPFSSPFEVITHNDPIIGRMITNETQKPTLSKIKLINRTLFAKATR